LYGCETSSLILREECRLKVFKNRVLRELSGYKWTGYQGSEEDHIKRSFMICTPHQMYLGDQIEKNKMGRACSNCEGEERCIQGFGGETLVKGTTCKT
jgi:hypothetical protein